MVAGAEMVPSPPGVAVAEDAEEDGGTGESSRLKWKLVECWPGCRGRVGRGCWGSGEMKGGWPIDVVELCAVSDSGAPCCELEVVDEGLPPPPPVPHMLAELVDVWGLVEEMDSPLVSKLAAKSGGTLLAIPSASRTEKSEAGPEVEFREVSPPRLLPRINGRGEVAGACSCWPPAA